MRMKRSKLEKLLDSEPLFKDPDLHKKINWQLVSNKCSLMTDRSLKHLEFSWIHVLSPLTNNNPWKIEEKRVLKSIVKDMVPPIDWDYVAKKLGTQRTPFSCFSRYQVVVISFNCICQREITFQTQVSLQWSIVRLDLTISYAFFFELVCRLYDHKSTPNMNHLAKIDLIAV